MQILFYTIKFYTIVGDYEMAKKRSDGECCGNCIETSYPDFGGACSYAGEIGSDGWCKHWKKPVKADIKMKRKNKPDKSKTKRTKKCECK